MATNEFVRSSSHEAALTQQTCCHVQFMPGTTDFLPWTVAYQEFFTHYA